MPPRAGKDRPRLGPTHERRGAPEGAGEPRTSLVPRSWFDDLGARRAHLLLEQDSGFHGLVASADVQYASRDAIVMNSTQKSPVAVIQSSCMPLTVLSNDAVGFWPPSEKSTSWKSAQPSCAQMRISITSTAVMRQMSGSAACAAVEKSSSPGTRLAKTRVTRCLIGKPGITYFYLGVRMFAHPWSGPSASAACTAPCSCTAVAA